MGGNQGVYPGKAAGPEQTVQECARAGPSRAAGKAGAGGKAVPRKYGCGSSIHRYFQEWLGAGFFDQIWKLGVEKYDELEGISWEWKSVGGSSVRVPVRQELVGQMLIGHRKEERQGQGL